MVRYMCKLPWPEDEHGPLVYYADVIRAMRWLIDELQPGMSPADRDQLIKEAMEP